MLIRLYMCWELLSQKIKLRASPWGEVSSHSDDGEG